MRKIFFALILNFFFISSVFADGNLSKYQEECLGFIQKPKVELFSSYGKLRYRFDKDAGFLKKETEKKFAEQNEKMDESIAPIGLTKVKNVFDFNFTVGTLNLSQGYVCVYPDTISARVEYSMPTIYILNTLHKDSCYYDLALRHEKTHMQIYIEALDYFLPKFKQSLDSLFDRIGFLIVSKDESVEEAAKRLNNNYLAVVQAEVDAWQKETALEQLKLDTPEHYIIENSICDHINGKI